MVGSERWIRASVLGIMLLTATSQAVLGQGLEGVGGQIDEPFVSRLLRGLLGMTFLLSMAWLFSARRKSIDWTLVAKGVGLQVLFALLVLKTGLGRGFFSAVNDIFVAMIGYTNAGASFLFGSLVSPGVTVGDGAGGVVRLGANFAFSVLPTIIFFSSLMAWT